MVREKFPASEKRQLCRSILESSVLDEKEFALLIDAMMKIPSKVLEEISPNLDRVVWICEGDRAGVEKISFTCLAKHEMEPAQDLFSKETILHIKPVYHKTYIMFMVEDNMKKLSRENKLEVIAHEFAHVYLGQDRIGGEEKEKEADMLITQWGFHPHQK